MAILYENIKNTFATCICAAKFDCVVDHHLEALKQNFFFFFSSKISLQIFGLFL